MSIQQVLAVIKQGNSASFPNQQAQRVFTNLRRNPRNSMEQINKAASLADQYLQNQVAGNKEFLKGQDIKKYDEDIAQSIVLICMDAIKNKK